MNLLLFLTRPKCLVALGVLVAAVGVFGRWGGDLRARWELWVHPPAASASRLAFDIVKDSQTRQSVKLRALHRSVIDDIQLAAREGFDVSHLQALADAALALDTNDSRSAAMENLNRLRLSIPRKNPGPRPAGRAR